MLWAPSICAGRVLWRRQGKGALRHPCANQANRSSEQLFPYRDKLCFRAVPARWRRQARNAFSRVSKWHACRAWRTPRLLLSALTNCKMRRRTRNTLTTGCAKTCRLLQCLPHGGGRTATRCSALQRVAKWPDAQRVCCSRLWHPLTNYWALRLSCVATLYIHQGDQVMMDGSERGVNGGASRFLRFTARWSQRPSFERSAAWHAATGGLQRRHQAEPGWRTVYLP